jgi:sec-independent protein translocase protein TatA
MGTFSIGHILILLLVVLLVFGTQRLRNLGGDLGEAIKGFRNAMREGDKEADAANPAPAPRLEPSAQGQVIDMEAKREENADLTKDKSRAQS